MAAATASVCLYGESGTGKELQRDLDGFSPAALQVLNTYDFPGNVRKLSNVVEQAVALAAGRALESHDLPEKLVHPQSDDVLSAAPHRPKSLSAAERDLIIEHLQAWGGYIALAAEDLGISRTTLWRRMKEYHIETRDLRRAEVAE